METINYRLMGAFLDDLSFFESKKDLTNLTIVIPTYGRPVYLLRQIAYLSKWKTR